MSIGWLLLIQYVLCDGAIFIESNSSTRHFSFGLFYLARNTTPYDVLLRCMDNDSVGALNLLLTGNAFMFHTLDNMERSALYFPSQFGMSHALNACTAHKESDEKEILLHFALLMWPRNIFAAKNLAYLYEYHGLVGVAQELFIESLAAHYDMGMELQWAFMTPPLYWDQSQSIRTHTSLLRRAHAILTAGPAALSLLDMSTNTPFQEIRELQMNFQYTGVSPGLAMDLYSQCVWHIYGPSFLRTSPPPRPYLLPQERAISSAIKLGVVSEHHTNSSPGLCLEVIYKLIDAILRLLATSCGAQSGLECSNHISITFFDRPALGTHFAASMRSIADRVVVLHNFDLEANINAISTEQVDILLYIALPTEKMAFLLAQHRLVPLQIVFGIGHPLTSGGMAIDYTVLSSRMVYSSPHSRHFSARSFGPSAAACAQAASNHSDVELAQLFPHCVTQGAGGNSYVEQPVFLESMGFYLEDASALYPDMHSFIQSQLSLEREVSCEAVDSLFRHWGVHPNLTARALRLPCIEETEPGPLTESIHLYACVQIAKKMHPQFDRVLAGILEGDPNAMILVSDAAADLIPRWKSSLALSEEDIYSRFLFLPRLPHPDYLQLLSFSAVFLNTFPFGSGITSAEALSVCVPVVVLPDLVSVLQIAFAQVSQLGQELSDLLIVHTVEAYVETAIRIASLQRADSVSLKQMICNHKKLLFGRELLDVAVNEWRELLQNLKSNTI